MDWLKSNLLAVFVVGVIAVVAARRLNPTISRWLLFGGLALIALAAIGVAIVAFSPPGGEDTVVQPEDENPDIEPPSDLLSILKTPWDTDGDASWPVAESLAMVSDIAYLPPVEAKAEYKAAGFQNVETFVDASMIGYVVSIEDAAVVAFRGTDGRSDWLANLDRFSINSEHGPIHRGFYNAYQPLKPQIAKILSEGGFKQVWITGHSLGGALAVVCAYDLIESEMTDVAGLITFGQPMVVRDELAKHLNLILASRFAHFVNEQDIVPRIPPSYRHCGSLVWYTGGIVRRSRPVRLMGGATEDESAANLPDDQELVPLSEAEFRELQTAMKANGDAPEIGPDGRPLMKGNSPFIRDHNMSLYLEKLRHSLDDTRE